jgi:hypothetical protein
VGQGPISIAGSVRRRALGNCSRARLTGCRVNVGARQPVTRYGHHCKA